MPPESNLFLQSINDSSFCNNVKVVKKLIADFDTESTNILNRNKKK